VNEDLGVEAPAPPSGAVAFLFSDVEGSTQLLRELSDDYAPLIDAHGRLLRETFETYGGRVVDSQGDSFFVVFPRIRDAAAAAAQAQRMLASHAWPNGTVVRVRIGLHAGEPLVAEERYVGLGVHRAARICAAAHGGQVLLSQAAGSLLADNEPPDVGLRDLGEHRLKDFDRAERLFQLDIDGLPSDFPPLRTEQQGQPSRVSLEFRILGPLEVVKDGQALALGGQRQRSVLALLLLRRGEVVSVDGLVDAIWGENPPRTATTSLQNIVSQLRKVLGPERLVTRAPGYVLALGGDEVDADRFTRLVEEARGKDPDERARRLNEALELCRGPALADFAYELFAQTEIERLEELRLAALEERIEADIERGRHAEVVGELEALVSQHPLRERARGQLMVALYRSGRQAEALSTYQDARRTLLEDLGIDPSPALQQLHAAILRQDRALAGTPSAERPEDHFDEVASALLAGRLVPVLGADVGELAHRLAERFEYPEDEGRELTRVAQYVALMQGSGPLYDELYSLLAVPAGPTAVHRFFAALPPILRERGLPHQLIVTTGYDLALEQAFLEAGEEFEVVSYLAAGPHRGKFCHFAPDGDVHLIDVPNTYATELSLQRRTVILKLHGGLDLTSERDWESFVVTEDDYIDYLGQRDVASAIPVALAAKLRRSHVLFLGYGMREWNLRVLLSRVWGGGSVSYRSWAVTPAPPPVERRFWKVRGVDLVDASLEEYVGVLGSSAGVEERTLA